MREDLRGFLLRARRFRLLSQKFLCVDRFNSPNDQTKSSQRRKKTITKIPVVWESDLSGKGFPKIFQSCKIRNAIFARRDKILPRVFPNARRFAAHKASCFQRSVTVLETFPTLLRIGQKQHDHIHGVPRMQNTFVLLLSPDV